MSGFGRMAKRVVRRAPLKTYRQWRLLRGDDVVVIAGPDKGKKGVIQEVLKRKNLVLVEGVNYRSKWSSAEGKRVQSETPVHMSNVMLADPATGERTKIAYRFLDGARVRVAKKSGSVVERPSVLTERLPRRDAGARDTNPDDVLEQTFVPPV
jgi:large subunit ribosomal protein L24